MTVKPVPQQLDEARRLVADEAFEDADFGEVTVAAHNGWEIDGDRFTKIAFMDIGAHDSEKMVFAVEFTPGTPTLATEPEFVVPDMVPSDNTAPIYGYYINLDERGEFFADVRGPEGNSVFEFGTVTMAEAIEDGFLKSKSDLKGIEDYLKQAGFIENEAEVLAMEAFESRLDERSAPSMGM